MEVNTGKKRAETWAESAKESLIYSDIPAAHGGAAIFNGG